MARWARLREAQKKKVLPTRKGVSLMQEAFALGRVLEYWSAKLPPGRLSHHLPQTREEKSCVLSWSLSSSVPGMQAGGGQVFSGHQVTSGA